MPVPAMTSPPPVATLVTAAPLPMAGAPGREGGVLVVFDTFVPALKVFAPLIVCASPRVSTVSVAVIFGMLSVWVVLWLSAIVRLVAVVAGLMDHRICLV